MLRRKQLELPWISARTPPIFHDFSATLRTPHTANSPHPQICSRHPDDLLEPTVFFGDLLDVILELQEERSIADLLVVLRRDLLVALVFQELLSEKENYHV